MGKILLSAIIPSKDREALALRAIASIRDQDRCGVEVVLVDDGSRDPYGVCERLSVERFIYLKLQKSVGPASARNAGVDHANGDWVVFLDDDDDWRPGFVDALYDRIEKSCRNEVFFWSSIINVDYASDGTVIGRRSRLFSEARHHNHMSLCSDALSIGTSWGLTVRRSTFTRVGKFDSSFRLTEDTEFIVRLLKAGCMPSPIAQPFVNIHHRVDAHRLTNQCRNQDRISEIERMLDIHSSYFDLAPRLADGLKSYAAYLRVQNG